MDSILLTGLKINYRSLRIIASDYNYSIMIIKGLHTAVENLPALFGFHLESMLLANDSDCLRSLLFSENVK